MTNETVFVRFAQAFLAILATAASTVILQWALVA